jgi:hypothetical protein
MFVVGFIPYVDTVSDVYFFLKAVYYEDWESAAFYGGYALLPFGASYFKAVGKPLAKTFGIRWLDDLLGITKRAPDPPTTPVVRNADDVITVRHYTNAAGKEGIEKSRYLQRGTFVTLPGEIRPGMRQIDIENLLCIERGKGAYYIDVQVPKRVLERPLNGPVTPGPFGGAWQRVLGADVPIGSARFLPTFGG